ncbi:MAG: primosomal protein N' [Chitinispirillaceae bacterium]|nr:primosomal protein N' [Chitinispirillaceae bacterium]
MIIDNEKEKEIELNEKFIAKVAFPVAISGTYDYLVPPELIGEIGEGSLVKVNLRNREVWGVVVELKNTSEHSNLKYILEVKKENSVKSDATLLKFYRWIAEYYQCEIGRAFKPLLRNGVTNASEAKDYIYNIIPHVNPECLNEKYKKIFSILKDEKNFTAAYLKEKYKISSYEIGYLLKRGFITRTLQIVLREAIELKRNTQVERFTLTDEQKKIVDKILKEAESPSKPFLLYGITGSGKTYVYIELALQTIAKGKGVIILVPEIALTPQTIQRFKASIGGELITVIHSQMSDGERRDSLSQLIKGEKRVVIGVRSAILVPVENLGLIIVDEEHDGSYKQTDTEPRYNARDVAVMRGKLQNAIVVLGSATPSLESYYNALSGKYELLSLLSRFGSATLPEVKIVDMREEHEFNNWKPLSRTLIEAIAATLKENRQTILLLNRRGFSTILLCKECGFTSNCPNCSVTLRYHKSETLLKCHVCGYANKAPDTCPKCKGTKIKYKGTGIQKVEEYLRETFPQARILRMDYDTTRRKGAHSDILSKFANREADILLGTQMVAKGLNFPGVGLVGVISADIGLHMPDFRAAERTFQLLTQVAGRAGRADNKGKVIIQTYSPNEWALRCVETHNYQQFFEEECKSRKALSYPPYGRLCRIVVSGKEVREVDYLINQIAKDIRQMGKNKISLLGPSPAMLEMVAKEKRYTVLLKTSDVKELGRVLKAIRKKYSNLKSSLRLIIDVDPVNML